MAPEVDFSNFYMSFSVAIFIFLKGVFASIFVNSYVLIERIQTERVNVSPQT